jgi:hypothetical protein
MSQPTLRNGWRWATIGDVVRLDTDGVFDKKLVSSRCLTPFNFFHQGSCVTISMSRGG